MQARQSLLCKVISSTRSRPSHPPSMEILDGPGRGGKKTPGYGFPVGGLPSSRDGAMKTICACGRGYWPSQKWQHEGCKESASNAASNGVSASNNASNAGSSVVKNSCGVQGGTDEAVASANRGSRMGSHQRWSREAYNRYQRFYMQTVRAVRAGRAEWIRRPA